MQILHIPLPFGDPLSMVLAAKNAKGAKKWKKSATTDAHNLSRKAVAFGIILTVRNGNASDLIAPRRDPPRSDETGKRERAT